jgi:multiple sugar transport system ATP-binding protein
MGDRVAVLNDGYLRQVDTPETRCDRPENVFVGAFIGSPSMNLDSGSIDVDGAGGIITLGSQTLSLSQTWLEHRPALRRYDGQQVVVGIRPEDFEDAAIAVDVPGSDQLHSEVLLIEALGSEIMVHFSIDAPVVDTGDPDEPEEIDVTTESLHFFDAQSRKAIYD